MTPGATSGQTTITEIAANNVQTTITEIAANNVFNVVYNKGTFDYTVNYYQDSIAAGNLLGSDPGSGLFGSTIPYTDGKYLPTGYVTPGATSGQTTITEIAANNVFNVVYNKGTFDYTVNYYQDSIAAGNLLGKRSGLRDIRQPPSRIPTVNICPPAM